MAQLRDKASDLGVTGVHGLRKDDLVHAVAEAMGKRSAPRPRRSDDSSGGGVRRGKASSKNLKYSQEVTSTDEEPERQGPPGKPGPRGRLTHPRESNTQVPRVERSEHLSSTFRTAAGEPEC
ncbi:Rho termination factor N-terminal domain-containing protein [Saccharothrix deserti]|uniref:Rho termination factor N-terminal domain-containing protein n=1 Tax=Saccharothrix deserti TaxID=2593674 RepID=UPI00131BCA25|nr:Rho termination factor N-terminal domain-containing protein [Saccharothrix deserti]